MTTSHQRYQPDYSACTSWQEIVQEHARTLYVPPGLQCDDPALTSWRTKANSSLEPPSDSEPGPKLATLLETLPSCARILDSRVHEIVQGKDATDIVALLKSGQLSVVETTKAFLAKTALVHQATGCLSHFFYHEALERAAELDQQRAECAQNDTLDQLGPMFGLPISIKGHLTYAHKGSQRGFVFDVLPDPGSHPLVQRSLTPEQLQLLTQTQGGYINQAVEHAHLVELLLAAGVVILGKTTMPQGIMHLDDRSNLYGQTLNPWNLALSPGGSSGGESALVAAGGTLMGVGSDIGGSIRQPSGVCNLYGLRPTTLRLPYAGVRSTMPGNEGVGSSLGPMALSLRDVQLFMSSIVNEHTRPWEREHSVLPLPWRLSVAPRTKPLVVGVMLHDGVVRPTPPVRRAMTHWIAKLQQHPGEVELRFWDPRDLHRRAWDVIRSLYFMDSGNLFHLLAQATGEPLLPLTQFILSEPFVRADGEMSASEVWAQVREREDLRRQFLAHWNAAGIDCLLCPVMGSVAPRPGQIRYWGYTSVFNLVDYPGIVLPSGMSSDAALDERAEEVQYPSEPRALAEPREPLSAFDADNAREYREHARVFDGAPIGLQLIGRRYHDEELVDHAHLLERLVRG